MSALRQPLRRFGLSTRTRSHDERGGDVSDRVKEEGPEIPLSAATDCRHLLILVHGFNNSYRQAQESYEVALAQLGKYFARSRYGPDAVAFFHWPGDRTTSLGNVADAVAYPLDIPQARKSAERLAEYLKQLPQMHVKEGSFRISLIGHSLGCRLICEMLHSIHGPVGSRIDIASLMAPAVPVQLVDEMGDLRLAVAAPRRILKFFSERDFVLGHVFALGQFAAYLTGTEDTFYSEAVGSYGNPLGMGIPCPSGNGHSDYWSDGIAAEKYTGALDPTVRDLPSLREVLARDLAPRREIEERNLAQPRR